MTAVSLLSKLCVDNPQNWNKNVDRVKQCLNNTPPLSTRISPFRIITALDIPIEGHEDIRKLIEESAFEELDQERQEIRDVARENISKIQAENRRTQWCQM